MQETGGGGTDRLGREVLSDDSRVNVLPLGELVFPKQAEAHLAVLDGAADDCRFVVLDKVFRRHLEPLNEGLVMRDHHRCFPEQKKSRFSFGVLIGVGACREEHHEEEPVLLRVLVI